MAPRRREVGAVVLDSWAVLAFFEGEPAGEAVSELFERASEGALRLLISTVNAGEVWYIVARQASEREADGAIDSLRKMGVEFVDADWSLVRLAAGFKARYRMSYADCIAAALARSQRAELVTGDPDFDQLSADVQIRFLEG